MLILKTTVSFSKATWPEYSEHVFSVGFCESCRLVSHFLTRYQKTKFILQNLN